jgi:hypothetical protein
MARDNRGIVAIWFLLLLVSQFALARGAAVVVGNEDSLLAALSNQSINTIGLLGSISLLDSASLVLSINRYRRTCSTSRPLRREHQQTAVYCFETVCTSF